MLLGWSVAWLIGSVLALWLTTGRGFARAFWLMSGLWCAVNVAVVVWALLSPPESVEQFRELLLVNVGLGVGYLIVGGVMLTRRAPLLRGFGVAILVQGGALMLFDLVWWLVLGRN